MKLQQLRYIAEVARRELNVSAAAEALHTSQPGVSRQIRMLEDELGVEIFTRSGRQLTQVTPAGERILGYARRILLDVGNIRTVAREFSDPEGGSLSVATTHTQARYVLPAVVEEFIHRYPKVRLQLHQGTPEQIAAMVAAGEVDCCIATEAMELFESLVMLPCYRWNRCIVVPRGHPLGQLQPLTLEAVTEYPIVTYVFGFTGRSRLDVAFRSRGLQPNVVFTATDSDVIKTYVRLGLGVGIIARMAYDPEADGDLCALDASHLFGWSTTRIGLRRGVALRRFLYDFIGLLGTHLTRERVDQALAASEGAAKALFVDVDLPVR